MLVLVAVAEAAGRWQKQPGGGIDNVMVMDFLQLHGHLLVAT